MLRWVWKISTRLALLAIRLSLLLVADAVAIEKACGDGVVLANRTAKPVRFELVDAGHAKPYTIEPGDLVTVHVLGPAAVRFTSGGKPHRFDLETDSAYFFHTTRTSDDPKLQQ